MAQEVDALCREWEPEPLVPAAPAGLPPVLDGPVIDRRASTRLHGLPAHMSNHVHQRCCTIDTTLHASTPALRSVSGPYLVIAGKRVLNVASTNFLGLAGNERVMVS